MSGHFWKATGMFEEIEVAVDEDAQIAIEGTYGHGRRSFHWMTPAQCRQLAGVLLAAAMDAEDVKELGWEAASARVSVESEGKK